MTSRDGRALVSENPRGRAARPSEIPIERLTAPPPGFPGVFRTHEIRGGHLKTTLKLQDQLMDAVEPL